MNFWQLFKFYLVLRINTKVNNLIKKLKIHLKMKLACKKQFLHNMEFMKLYKKVSCHVALLQQKILSWNSITLHKRFHDVKVYDVAKKHLGMKLKAIKMTKLNSTKKARCCLSYFSTIFIISRSLVKLLAFLLCST